MSNKQKPWCLACFLWQAWENNAPSSLLPIPSPAVRRSQVVSPDALQQKSLVQRTVSLSCAPLHYTPFIIINTRNCWNSPCEWKISLLNFQRLPAHCLQPQGWGRVCTSGRGLPAMLCVPSAHSLPWQEGSSPSLLLPAGMHGAALPKAGSELASATQSAQGAREAALALYTSKGVLLDCPLLKRKELLQVEGAGGKFPAGQFLSLSWSIGKVLPGHRAGCTPFCKHFCCSVSSLFPLLTSFLLIFF